MTPPTLALATVVASIAASAGCGDDAAQLLDASVVADGSTSDSPEYDPGPCGDDMLVTAAFVGLDHSEAAPAPIAGATFTAQADATRTAISAADGHFELCVPVSGTTVDLRIAAPGDHLAGFLTFSDWAAQQYRGWGTLYVRSFSAAGASELYSTQFGVQFDPARAHVLVINACDGDSASLDRPHDAAQSAYSAADEAPTWAPGSEGHYVLFPNVDVSQPSGTTSSSGQSIEIPLQAGRLTIAVQCTVYL
jgi:hypothetical protein